MAGNRIDMIERAAARLRRDAPEQKPGQTIAKLPEKSTIATAGARPLGGLSPISPRFIHPPKPLSPVVPAPVAQPVSPQAELKSPEPGASEIAPAAQPPSTDQTPVESRLVVDGLVSRQTPVAEVHTEATFPQSEVTPAEQSPTMPEKIAQTLADVSAAIRSLAPIEPPAPANESVSEALFHFPETTLVEPGAPSAPVQEEGAALVNEASPVKKEATDVPVPPSDTAPEVNAADTSARHSRTVVLDTARLALAGTIDWSSDRTPVMEELRLIKRRLLRRAFNSANGPDSISHLVMITSSKPREGKTFTATNIAISISLEEDYNVLLVDADIRRQALRQNLGLEANQGFVDLLLNPSLDMADVLLRTNIPRLSVLPAGTMRDRAPELLASSRMRDLIDDMAQRYSDRIIIFDTAPCLVSSDAATLAAHVGQIVFVIEAEQTQQHEIVAALNLISACPDISLVLNKAQPLSTTSYGGYGAY